MLPVNDRDNEQNTRGEAIRKLIEKISEHNTENGNHGKMFQDAARTLINIGGSETVKLLVPLLSSEEPEKRTFAVDILVRIGKDALPYLCGLMDNEDNDSYVRKIVLDIIRMIPAPESEEYLIRFLFDDDVNVAVAAAEALGSCGTMKSVPYLVQCMEKEPWLRCAALKSLGSIGGEEALSAICSIGEDEENLVLFCAVQAVGAVKSAKGVDFLLRILEGPNEQLMPHVILALTGILEKNNGEIIKKTRGKIEPGRLIGLLKGNNRALVRSAIKLLGLFREQSAVNPLISLYTEANEPLFDIIENAILAIRPVKIEPFIKIFQSPENTDSMKLSALHLLGRLGNPDTALFLIKNFNDFHDHLKPAVIRTLGILKDERALPLLHASLLPEPGEISQETGAEESTGAVEDIQMTALEALAGFHDPSSIPFLLGLSTASSDNVRSGAAALLADLDLEAYQHEILPLLTSTNDKSVVFGLEMIPGSLIHLFREAVLENCLHSSENVRRAAVGKASKIQDNEAFNKIAKCLNDEASTVRRSAIRGIAGYAGKPVEPLLTGAVQNDPDDWNRYEAVQMIRKLKLTRAVPEMAELLPRAHDLVKAGILDLLAELGGLKYESIISPFTESENPRVKEAAIEALDALSGSSGSGPGPA